MRGHRSRATRRPALRSGVHRCCEVAATVGTNLADIVPGLLDDGKPSMPRAPGPTTRGARHMQAATLQDHAAAHAWTIPLMRAQLPDADALLPYLQRIDAARWYTNFGPLVVELEQRLAAQLDADDAP